jgi:hypothetical protein
MTDAQLVNLWAEVQAAGGDVFVFARRVRADALAEAYNCALHARNFNDAIRVLGELMR